MKTVIIDKAGVVVNPNVALPESMFQREAFVSALKQDGMRVAEAADEVEVGWVLKRTKFHAPEIPVEPISEQMVNAERERRINAGFEHDGVRYQSRDQDRENIAGAAQLAFMAIVGGVEAGNLRWHGGETDFVWIATDNSLVPMDAHAVVDLGKAAAAHKSAHIMAARALKDMDPVPQNYREDEFWP